MGEDALVDLAHLPGAGDDAAAVDHGGHAEARPVLLDQQLGGELGGAVEGAGAAPAGSARRCRPARRRGPAARRRARSGSRPPPAQLDLRRHRVDAAGREEDDEGAVAAGQLEAVVGAGEVGVDEVAGVAVDAAHHRGLGRALDQGVDPRHERSRSSGSRTSPLDELDPRLLQARQVELRAAPVEVVERDDLPVGMARGERDGEVGADEAGAAGDQQAAQEPPAPRFGSMNWNSLIWSTVWKSFEHVVDERAVRTEPGHRPARARRARRCGSRRGAARRAARRRRAAGACRRAPRSRPPGRRAPAVRCPDHR